MNKTYKIVLVSDNHGKRDVIKKILELHEDADYFIHCGDSEMDANELEKFIYVRGNVDFYGDFPIQRILEIGSHRILLIHGNYHVFYMHYPSRLIAEAKKLNCDTVFYGHLHVYKDETLEGIRMLNPGSLRNNRDMSGASYMIVTIDGDTITATRMNEPK